MNIKPIRSDEDLTIALARIEELFGAAEGTAESDELEVLSVLAEAYEAEHFPMNYASPAAAIKFQMDLRGLTEKDLEQWIGSAQQVADVLAGSQPLTLEMIRALHKGLKISYETLMSDV